MSFFKTWRKSGGWDGLENYYPYPQNLCPLDWPYWKCWTFFSIQMKKLAYTHFILSKKVWGWFILQLLYVFFTIRKGWINVYCFVLLHEYAWWWPCAGLKGRWGRKPPSKFWKLWNLLDNIVIQIIGNKVSSTPSPSPLANIIFLLTPPSPQKKFGSAHVNNH